MKVKRKNTFIFCLLPFAFCLLSSKILLAQTPSDRTTTPPRNRCRNIITENTISQTGVTNPSLWWASERFGGQLLDTWLVCQDERRVTIIVNRQVWTLLDYLERYEFVNHFGAVSRDYGYNLRVLNQQRGVLATYTCNFSVSPATCNLWIDTIGRDGFQRPSAVKFLPQM